MDLSSVLWNCNLSTFDINIGVGQHTAPVLDLKKELRAPISLANLFEAVAEDLQTLNQNLQSVSAYNSCLTVGVAKIIDDFNCCPL